MADIRDAENLIVAYTKVPELRGWPVHVYGLPTDRERAMIKAIHGELMLNEPGLEETRCWFLAGSIVAVIRRDVDGGTW